MFSEYIVLLKFMFFSLMFAVLLFTASCVFVYQTPYSEKVSAYECGFNPWGDARSKFEVRFYLVAILFIIFDLEISFLVPYIICFSEINAYGTYSVFIFLFILTIVLFMSELKEL